MSTIRVVNVQHTDATEPNIVLLADGTSVFASGITISGGTNLTVSGTAEFASGTVSAPGVTFIDDNNTGLYSPAADTVAITTAATERVRVDSSGRLLLGTTTEGLATYGDKLTLANVASDCGMTIRSGTSSLGAIYFADSDSGAGEYAGLFEYSHNDNYMRFGTVGAERLRIDSSGNVRIGQTTGASAKLSIYGSQCRFQGASTGTGESDGFGIGNNGATDSFIWNYENGFIQIGTNSIERMRIDSAGNVGIGNTAPAAKLHLEATSEQLRITHTSVVSYRHEAHSNGDYSINKDGTERMRIRDNGDVIIGPYRGPATYGTVAENIPYSIKVAPYGWQNGSEIASISMGSHGGTGQDDGQIVFKTGSNVHSTPNALQERARILSTGGITFNGDTAQANALDDYEEGSCTITLYISGTSTTNSATNTVAYYSKVGNIVNVSYYSGPLSITNGGTAEINGLPFVSKNVNQHYPPAVFTHTNCFTTDIQNGYMNVNSNNLYPMQRNSTTPASWNTSGGNRYLMFSITYQTN